MSEEVKAPPAEEALAEAKKHNAELGKQVVELQRANAQLVTTIRVLTQLAAGL